MPFAVFYTCAAQRPGPDTCLRPRGQACIRTWHFLLGRHIDELLHKVVPVLAFSEVHDLGLDLLHDGLALRYSAVLHTELNNAGRSVVVGELHQLALCLQSMAA